MIGLRVWPWRPRRRVVNFQQAVYGSFPFWNRGYALLAQSPGCRPEWITALQQVGRQFGQPGHGVRFETSWLMLPPTDLVPRLLVGVSNQGCDDRGRPNSLAFHGLFLDERTYWHLERSPFPLLGALESQWSAEQIDRPLPEGRWRWNPADRRRRSTDPGDYRVPSRLDNLLASLEAGRPVAVESPAPIDAILTDLWPRLTKGQKRRLSVASWAFANLQRYDCAASPQGPHGPSNRRSDWFSSEGQPLIEGSPLPAQEDLTDTSADLPASLEPTTEPLA